MGRLLYGSCRIVLITAVLAFAFIINAQAATIYVPDDYSTIQQAVDAALPGDIIIVRDGTYVDKITVFTPNLTIKSENGPNTCIIQAINIWSAVFNIYANYTTISGFTIRKGSMGILLEASHNVTVEGSIIRNNKGKGIRISNAYNATIRDNLVANNSGDGIYISASNATVRNNLVVNNSRGIWIDESKAVMENNTVEDARSTGIYIYESTAVLTDTTINSTGSHGLEIRNCNKVTLNSPLIIENAGSRGIYAYFSNLNLNLSNATVRNSKSDGIYVYPYGGNELVLKDCIIEGNGGSGIYWPVSGTHNVTVEGSIIRNNKGKGIRISNAYNATIRDNLVANNSGDGIYISASNSTILNNTVNSNEYGIKIHSGHSYIVNNIIANSSGYGIYLSGSSSGNHIYYNSFIENRNGNVQAYDSSTNSQWNSTNRGNYWSDYTTRYPSATNDGVVWDTPYVIEGYARAKDNFPLVHPVTAIVFIFRITPSYGPNITSVNTTIYGLGFTDGVDVRLVKDGEEDIRGEDVKVLSESQITARFNLTGRATGLWDLVVSLPTGEESRLEKAFEIRGFVYDIFPKYGFNVTKQLVTIYGYGFTEGVDVKLTREGEEDILGEDTVVLDKTRFTTKFNLTGRATGLWDLVVTLPTGEQDSLANAFEIFGVRGKGYLLQNITIEAGESQEYGIEVPETHNLFITLQKTTLISYGNSWSGRLSLLKNGTVIASTKGSHDLILHIVDPEPGLYAIKIEAYQAGSGILTVSTSLPELPLGEWVVGTIYTSYGSVWYQVEVPPNQDSLYFEAEGMGWGSRLDIYYEKYGSSDHWVSPYGPRTSIEIPNPKPGTYIVEFMDSAMIWEGGVWSGRWAKDQTRDVLIKADTKVSYEPPPDYLPTITSISPDRGGNAGFVTVEIKGGWLDQNATVSLVRSGYEDIIAQNVYGSDEKTKLIATFNLMGKEPGEWNLVVTNPDGRNATAPTSFTIEEGGKPELWVEIVGREKVRVRRQSQYILRYGNSGNVDMPAPLFSISSSSPTPDSPPPVLIIGIVYHYFEGETIKVLGKGPSETPGILPAGSSFSVPFYIKTPEEGEFSLRVSAITANPIFEVRSLANFRDAFCPAPGIPLLFSRVYLQDSSYLGPLGKGWIHNYDLRLEELSDGNIALLRGDSYVNFFLSNGDNTYTAFMGYSTLSRSPDGTFKLKQKDGTVYGFRSDLRFDYVEDTNGNSIRAVYNSDQLIKLQHSCGDSFSFEYNENGRISRLIDHAGRITEYHYDESGELLTSVKLPDGKVTSYSYDEQKLTSISYPSGIKQFFEYDGDNRLSKVYLNDMEEVIRYAYDVDNRTTYITDAEGNTASIHVDEFGQITWLVDPTGAVAHFEYDGFNLKRVVDPMGNTYNFDYDGKGNIVEIKNPLNHKIRMSYDPDFNKITWLKDARGNEISFSYDEHGNLLSITYPDSSQERMEYDSEGNPIRLITRKGDTIEYTYNDRGQLIRKDYPDGSWVAYEYDDAGNMISATDENGKIEMEYNALNQLTKITYPSGHFFEYSYDAGGRLIKRVDQDGYVLNYQYDDTGRLVRLSDKNDTDIVRYEYDKVGRVSKKILGNGDYTTYEYDAAGRILHLVNYNASGKVISRFDYTYDPVGNPISITTLEGTYRYEYDSIGQLTKVTYPDGHYVSYFYDAAGNRIAVIEDGKTTNYTTNNMNQYTKVGNVSYSYDANGNLISKIENGQTTTYEYDFENRLVKVTSPEGTWEYVYDALGNRIAVIHNGTERKYLVDPLGIGDVVAEYDESGDLVARYIHGLGLISQVDGNGNQYYYHFNPIGHTTEITDENGNVVNHYRYSPFGEYLEKKESIPNPFTFVGEFGVMDDGNGLNYMRMRYYSPEIGRFLSEDPFMTLENRYIYAKNSPILLIDPLGLFNWKYFSGYLKDKLVEFVFRLAGEYLSGDDVSTQEFVSNYIGLSSKVGMIFGAGFALKAMITEGAISLSTLIESASTGAILFMGAGLIGCAIGVKLSNTRLITNPDITYGEWFENLFYQFLYRMYYGKWPGHTIYGDWPTKIINSVQSSTPEDKYGPTGFDLPDTPFEERKRFVPPDKNLYYRVDFWNKENATAPACDVFVTDQLDPNLDWNTFRFEEIGFLNWTVKLEPCQYFNIYVDTRPEMNLIVNVEGTFDPETGVINWTFRSLDPETLETPEDPMAGFLPPITENGYEIGWVAFSVSPKDGLPSGTQIENQAYVEFDWAGDLLEHPAPKEGPWVNTIDALPPASTVTAEVMEDYNIQLNWTGEDDPNGSGIKDYTIYVSVDGGDYLPYLTHTTNNSTVFTGEPGHTYTFYSIARDNVGNIEGVPEEPDATVVFENEAPIADANGPYTGIEGQPVIFDGSASYDPEGQPLTYHWNFGDGETGTGVNPTHVYAQDGTYTITLTVNDGAQDSTPSTTTATIEDSEPIADFTADIVSGSSPLTVQFTDLSASYDGIIAWEWDFDGDGVIDSDEQNPSWTYTGAGTYTVSLTVYEADGDSDTETKVDYITVTSAADTEPPTIESVTLDTYINIPDSSFHVTVEATDNVGVTSVTADGVALVETGGIWEGNITAPSSTGEYTLTIRAEDAAGNFAETTVDYSVVKPSGSIGIGVDPRLTTVSAGGYAIISITLVSTENFDDIAYVYLTTEGVYPGYEANLAWFNWTSKYVKVPAGATVKVPLKVNIPVGESGYKVFYAKLESTKWTPTAMDTGVLYII